jgi:hypothetical protein
MSIQTGIVAYGSNQSDSFVLSCVYNQIVSAPLYSGVVLSNSTSSGQEVYVRNDSLLNLTIYPQYGGDIDNSYTNDPVILLPNEVKLYFCVDGTSWKSMNF